MSSQQITGASACKLRRMPWHIDAIEPLDQLLQLVVLGAGSFIGDMTVISDKSGALRKATVAALTPLTALRITNARFRRIVSLEVLERMRAVAAEKDVLTKHTIAEEKEVRAVLTALCRS